MRSAARGRLLALGLLALCLLVVGACGEAPPPTWSYAPGAAIYDPDWHVTALAPGDFDADGHVDLLAADPIDGRVYFLRGLGGGRFATPPAVPVLGRPGARELIVGSFDADPFPDLLLLDRSTGLLDLYLGTGTGGFRAGPPPPPLHPLGLGLVAVVATSVDGDDLTDLVMLDELGDVHVLRGRGDGSFDGVPGGTVAGAFASDVGTMREILRHAVLVVAEVDGGGGLDVVLLDPLRRRATLWGGVGDGSLLPPRVIDVPVPHDLVAAVPCRGAGADSCGVVLLCGAEDGVRSVERLFTRGARAGQISPSLEVGAATGLVTAEVTGDGVPDLIVCVPSAREVRVYPSSFGSLTKKNVP